MDDKKQITRTSTSLTDDELSQLLTKAGALGAKRVLNELGLDGESAKYDIRELRQLIEAYRLAKKTFWLTIIRTLTRLGLIALFAGIGYSFMDQDK